MGSLETAGAGAGLSARRCGAGSGLAARASGVGGRAGRAAGAGEENTGAVATEGDGADAVADALSDGGSNSNVYSRTRRPVDHDNSRITSTKGSWTTRSLVRRRKGRPSGRLSSAACVVGNTLL